MTLEDLANYKGEWVEPARTDYHGYDILELPPPAQAWAAEEILNILDACVPQWTTGRTLASLGPTSPQYWHFLIEAKKLAYADLYQYNADPNFASVPLRKLLSEKYAASLCGKVDPRHASRPGPAGKFFHAGRHDRAVDRRFRRQHGVLGQQQLFRFRFGPDGAGLRVHSAQSRRVFTLESQESRMRSSLTKGRSTPCRRASSCTTIEPLMTVTLMGGDMQAQGHAQLLVDILDLGANLQAAADMARFRHSPGIECAELGDASV